MGGRHRLISRCALRLDFVRCYGNDAFFAPKWKSGPGHLGQDPIPRFDLDGWWGLAQGQARVVVQVADDANPDIVLLLEPRDIAPQAVGGSHQRLDLGANEHGVIRGRHEHTVGGPGRRHVGGRDSGRGRGCSDGERSGGDGQQEQRTDERRIFVSVNGPCGPDAGETSTARP